MYIATRYFFVYEYKIEIEETTQQDNPKFISIQNERNIFSPSGVRPLLNSGLTTNAEIRENKKSRHCAHDKRSEGTVVPYHTAGRDTLLINYFRL